MSSSRAYWNTSLWLYHIHGKTMATFAYTFALVLKRWLIHNPYILLCTTYCLVIPIEHGCLFQGVAEMRIIRGIMTCVLYNGTTCSQRKRLKFLHFTYDNLKGTHMMAVSNWKRDTHTYIRELMNAKCGLACRLCIEICHIAHLTLHETTSLTIYNINIYKIGHGTWFRHPLTLLLSKLILDFSAGTGMPYSLAGTQALFRFGRPVRTPMTGCLTPLVVV